MCVRHPRQRKTNGEHSTPLHVEFELFYGFLFYFNIFFLVASVPVYSGPVFFFEGLSQTFSEFKAPRTDYIWQTLCVENFALYQGVGGIF